jgi:hypothetical protein
MSPNAARSRQELTFLSLSAKPEDLPLERLPAPHRQVAAYWLARRGVRRAPRRADFDPLDLPSVLPNLALWDCDETGDYRCRLAGTEIDASIGMPLKGVALSAIPCTRLGEAQVEFAAARDLGHASLAERTMDWAGKPYRYYRHLLLPFLDGRDEITTLLSVLTFHAVAERRRG